MDYWHDVQSGENEELNVIVECPKFSRIKYEVDKATGLIKYDRVLFSPMHYPTNYGFVPQTLWEDDDPLDVLVMGEEPITPGALVTVRPIGTLAMIDGGDNDIKILGVPTEDPRFNEISDTAHISLHMLAEIKHFFTRYKELQNKTTEVGDWSGKDSAIAAVEKSRTLYKEKFAGKNA